MKCSKCKKDLNSLMSRLKQDYVEICHNHHKGIHHSCWWKHRELQSDYRAYLKNE